MQNTIIQGSPEWLEMRKRYIGASDAPVIMEVSPYKTKHELWEEKLGLSPEKPASPAMLYGLQTEEEARRAYEKHTGNLVFPTVVFHKENDFMMASLDGLSLDRDIVVEIKNVCEKDHAIAKKGNVPDKYFPQTQHILECLNLETLHYFSYRSGDFALVEVQKDDKYISTMVKMETKFWDNVSNFVEPELSDRDYLQMDSEEWKKTVADWQLLDEQLKAISDKEKECRKMLIRLADEKSSIGSGLKLTKSTRKGSIDYDKIEALKDIDIEIYRKSPITAWRFTRVSK